MTARPDTGAEDLARELGERLRHHGLTVGVAESLTGGNLASNLSKAPGAGEWFRGGVVAYAEEVKYDLLRVRQGPVVSEGCALDMAGGVCRVLGADVGIAVTGVGGPDAQDGQPAGTVWLAVHHANHSEAELHRFPGSPEEVVDATCRVALRMASDRIGN